MHWTHPQAVSRREDPLCSAVMAPHHHGVWECAQVHGDKQTAWRWGNSSCEIVHFLRSKRGGNAASVDKSHSVSPRKWETPAAGHFQTAAGKKGIMTVWLEEGVLRGCSTEIQWIFSQLVWLSGSGSGAAAQLRQASPAWSATRRAQNSKLKRSERRCGDCLPLSLPACVGVVRQERARKARPAPDLKGLRIKTKARTPSSDAPTSPSGARKPRTFQRNVSKFHLWLITTLSRTTLTFSWLYYFKNTLILKSTPKSRA